MSIQLNYEGVVLKEEIQVEKIVTVHYFEYMKNFCFPGEFHDFWEFQCVDKGEVHVLDHTLQAGQVIFHQPNEFHNLVANGEIAPNVVVVAFECHSPAMKFFEGKILEITDNERNLLGMIISEARRCFATPLDDPYLAKMKKKDKPSFASEQLIKLYLESFLLYMIRRHLPETAEGYEDGFERPISNSFIYQKIIAYLKEHIRGYVTIDDICRENLIGRSQLQKVFREQHNCGVIDYFTRLKVEYAKQLIREQNQNFTQIAEYLGYSSIHYFSRQFKKITGMTPSEYTNSIKALSERK